MTTPSSPLLPAASPPSLARIASVVHRSSTDGPTARVVSVRLGADATMDLGFWDVPPSSLHPIEPLVGFVAPPEWDAIGLVSTGRLRHLDRPEEAPEPVMSTVLLGRDASAASVIGPPGEDGRPIDSAPFGLVPDVLRRTIGHPTPPPEASTAALVELTWLDRLAAGVLQQRPRVRSWRWLADRHPLRNGGTVPSPDELAARTAAYGQERTWADLRLLGVTDDLPAVRWGPPGGSTAPAATWFDDGSLSRWMLSKLPPAEALVPDLLAVLPTHVGADLLAALEAVDGAWPADGGPAADPCPG